MKKLNKNEMTNTRAGGCGVFRRAARQARRNRMWGLEQFFVDQWIICKKL